MADRSIQAWSILFVGALAFSLVDSPRSAAQEHFRLDAHQLQTILTEAVQLHTDAVRASGDFDVSAALKKAVQKYRLATDAGLRSPQLYTNLADAQLRLGSVAVAVANLEQAHRLAPDNRDIAIRLRNSREELKTAAVEQGAPAPPDAWRSFTSWSLWLPSSWVRFVALLSWTAFWLVVCVRRVFGSFFASRSVAFVAACCFVITTSMLVLDHRIRSSYNGIVISTEATVHAGDGASFPSIARLQPGQRILMDERRGDWWRVAVPGQQSGWVQAQDVQLLSSSS